MTPTAHVPRTTTADHVAAEIRRRIWVGELHPGDRLPQEELAGDLGVSRIPVRDAFLALEREGVVQMAPHKGAFVERIDESTVADHYELYGVVDGFALRKTMQRADDGELDELAALVRSLRRADDPVDLQQRMRLLRATIHDLGGSPRFRAVAGGLTGIVPGNFFVEVPGAMAVVARRSPGLARAIARRDEDAAVAHYGRMMREQGAAVADVLRSQGTI